MSLGSRIPICLKILILSFEFIYFIKIQLLHAVYSYNIMNHDHVS